MIVSFGQLATMGHLSPLKILAICRAARSTLYKIPYSSMHQWSGKHSSVRSIVEQYLHHWLNFTDWLALQPNVAISVANTRGTANPATSDEDPPHRRTQLRQLSHLRRATVDRRRASRKQLSSVEAVLTGGNNQSGKVLPEIMIIVIYNKKTVGVGL